MRCKGYKRYGSFMAFGPRKWEQCEADGVVMLKVDQNGKKESLPACTNCWNDVKKDGITIFSVDPIPEERFEHE